MSEGVALSSQPPEYLDTKLADLRVALIEDATRDAKTRAEAIAKRTGSAVGTVRQARVGVFQITPRFSTEIADYGMNDVSAIEKGRYSGGPRDVCSSLGNGFVVTSHLSLLTSHF